jgi:hypothetical protein
MSEEIHRFVAGEDITVTTMLRNETSGMEHTEVRSLLGKGYRLDLVSVPGAIVLRREDGTEVSRFRVRDATRQAIEQAAHKDQRTNQRE